MKLLIKQRFFTLTDNYHVYDEFGEIRYDVESAFLSLGHRIHVYDRATGCEVGAIRQKLFTLTPEFEIVVDGQVMGTIRKKFTLFLPRYQVDYKNWEVDGDLMGWDYRVTCNGSEIMTITKEVLNWTDTYSLNFFNPANEIPGLLLVLAIDAVNCNQNND